MQNHDSKMREKKQTQNTKTKPQTQKHFKLNSKPTKPKTLQEKNNKTQQQIQNHK